MIEQVAWNKLSLLLKFLLQKRPNIKKIIETEIFYKLIKMPILKPWAKRPCGLIKSRGRASAFNRECLD